MLLFFRRRSTASLLLDTYSGATAAYSLRKLRTAYTGSAIRVRRGGSTTEQDIGFDSNGVLDESALSTFVGANDGYVVTWYDQSGNGNDATQASPGDQPRIAKSGVIVYTNSLPSIDFDGSSDFLSVSFGSALSQPSTFFIVAKYADIARNDIMDSASEGGDRTLIDAPTNHRLFCGSVLSGNITSTEQFLRYSLSNGTSSEIALNGLAATTGDAGSTGVNQNITIGKSLSASNNFLEGSIQEFVLYNSNKSANKSGIETKINNYYDIYPSGFNGYDIVLLIGQSNMVGRTGPIDPVLDATNSRILQYGFDSNTLKLAEDPLDHQDEDPGEIGPGLSFAKDYLSEVSAGRGLLLVPCADGGTSFQAGNWRAGGLQLEAAITSCNEAMALGSGTNNLVGILWHQGENDAGNGGTAMTESEYRTEIEALIADLRSRLTGASSTTPFVCGDLAQGWNVPDSNGVRAALADVPNNIANTDFVSSVGVGVAGDGIHFSAAGYRELGARYATALKGLI